MKILDVAVIGCGAIAELGYLPTLSSLPHFRLKYLIDPNTERTLALAKRFGGQQVKNYKEVLGQFDAAVLALPHSLHEPFTTDLLSQNIHVFLEKPTATSVKEVKNIMACEQKSSAVLAIGQMRRTLHGPHLAKSIIDSGILGKLQSFDIQEGGVYAWPVASDFFWNKATSGGGVLLDTGAHTLDLMNWWFGPWQDVEYFDDELGGVEANCKLLLKMQSGLTGKVELSRARRLRNTLVLKGENGELEASLVGNQVWLRGNTNLNVELQGFGQVFAEPHTKTEQALPYMMSTQLNAWYQAITEKAQPLATAKDSLPVIELIETCYKNKKPLCLPWVDSSSAVTPSSSPNTILGEAHA